MKNIKEPKTVIVNHKRYSVVHTDIPYPCKECALAAIGCGDSDCGRIDRCSCLKKYHKPKTYIK